jgi:hypothetical protein
MQYLNSFTKINVVISDTKIVLNYFSVIKIIILNTCALTTEDAATASAVR